MKERGEKKETHTTITHFRVEFESSTAAEKEYNQRKGSQSRARQKTMGKGGESSTSHGIGRRHTRWGEKKKKGRERRKRSGKKGGAHFEEKKNKTLYAWVKKGGPLRGKKELPRACWRREN